jgi:glycerol-3-phosphate dehydrogenase
MAEHTVDTAIKSAGLTFRHCHTEELKIHGYQQHASAQDELEVYGSDSEEIRSLIHENPKLSAKLHKDLPYSQAQVIWAARYEMARTIEDVLARRTRALFLDARAAMQMAPEVARIMAEELGRDLRWKEKQLADFAKLATHYVLDHNLEDRR